MIGRNIINKLLKKETKGKEEFQEYSEFHPLLQRQLKKHFGGDRYSQNLEKLFQNISEAYVHADEDRKLAERSLELNSRDLTQANKELRQKVGLLDIKTQDLEKMNRFMIGREVKMIALKKEIKKLKKLLQQNNIKIPDQSS